MSGCLFVFVGASGVGKDSVLRCLKNRMPELHIAKRVITRKQHTESEDYESLSPEQFITQLLEGAFIFHWRAHGVRYGIRKSVNDILQAGGNVAINGSRAALEEMRAIYPALHAISINVDLEVLEARLIARGRENEDEIAARLKRASQYQVANFHSIANNGALEEAVDQCVLLMKDLMRDVLSA